MQQVLVNLLLNAADAMESQPVRRVVVRTFATEFPPAPPARRRAGDREPPSGAAVGLSVADTGPGIDPAHLPALFDPFFTTKEPGKGTGLGLAISRTIVESMGGTISAANGPQGGAVFTVLLPPRAA